jgi:hypothetical protein
MRDRIATIGPIAAVAGVLGLCCGLPVLLSIGMVGTIGGWSLQSWALIGVGLAAAAVGWARWARSRRDDDTCRRPVSSTHVDAAPDQTADSTTDATTKGTNR